MKLNSEELNLARRCLLYKTVKYFLKREGIKALYVQGSVAADLTDEFSDIDFRVVIESKLYKKYISERFSAPKRWGEWIYNEWAVSRPWICVSHFKPFNKIDVLYLKPEEIQPSPWFLLPAKIIYDPEGLIRQIIQVSDGLKFTIDIEEIDRLISKGLAYAEEAYRRVMRDEMFYAQSLLDSFRQVLMQFENFLENRPHFVSHFEQRGSKTSIEILKLSYTSLEKKLMLQALSRLLKLYKNQIVKLYKIVYLQRDREADLLWINNIDNLCKGSTYDEIEYQKYKND